MCVDVFCVAIVRKKRSDATAEEIAQHEREVAQTESHRYACCLCVCFFFTSVIVVIIIFLFICLYAHR